MKTENLHCDRCKKLIEADSRTNCGYHLYRRKFLVHKLTDDNLMDLCQDCYKSLRDWVKQEKENKQ